MSLASTTAYGMGSALISLYETQGVGLQWSNIGGDSSECVQYTFLVAIRMIVLDTFLYAFIAWYVQSIKGSCKVTCIDAGASAGAGTCSNISECL